MGRRYNRSQKTALKGCIVEVEFDVPAESNENYEDLFGNVRHQIDATVRQQLAENG